MTVQNLKQRSLLLLLGAAVASQVDAAASGVQARSNHNTLSTDGSCGRGFAGKGKGMHCPGSTCCSQWGWCGNGPEHCLVGCQSGFGVGFLSGSPLQRFSSVLELTSGTCRGVTVQRTMPVVRPLASRGLAARIVLLAGSGGAAPPAPPVVAGIIRAWIATLDPPSIDTAAPEGATGATLKTQSTTPIQVQKRNTAAAAAGAVEAVTVKAVTVKDVAVRVDTAKAGTAVKAAMAMAKVMVVALVNGAATAPINSADTGGRMI